jgi:DNA polymerase IV
VGSEATILHADLDAFYASVEQLLDPSLLGIPIAVGGSGSGGVVLAASYEAKRFGVTGGMSGWKAVQLCPSLQFVSGHFGEYQRLADAVMSVLNDVTPLVERISIDEAFCEVAGARRLFGSPSTIAAAVRARVRDEIGLPISVGIARTKHLAKIASQVAKPDGMVVVEPGDEQRFLRPLPVALVWGVGPVTQTRLAAAGITTIGELADADPRWLRQLVGDAAGTTLGALARNVDDRRVVTARRARSIGAQSAFGRRVVTDELLAEVLGHLADRVTGRMRAKAHVAYTVTVRVRFAGVKSVTRSLTVPQPVSSTLTLVTHATALVHCALTDHPNEHEVSLLAISLSNLDAHAPLQLVLPFHEINDAAHPGSPLGEARQAVDHSLDAVRQRFGHDALSYGAVRFATLSRVPDNFRSLAEHEL